MAFSFGFYNSFNHDRRYNSIQISMIFDGIISDGIYATIGEAMVVKATEEDNIVIVGPGRGWFDHTWNYNDADLPVNAPISDVLLKRIDALVLDINANEDFRENKIMWVQGTPSSNPVRPTMINTLERHQYPLCYVERKPNVEKILQADITNMVGSSECPFVTGILQTIDIDQLLLQWKDQWTQWVTNQEALFDTWSTNQREVYESWTEEQKAAFISWYTLNTTAWSKEIMDWFESIKGKISEDEAVALQLQIDELTSMLVPSNVAGSIEHNRDAYITCDGFTTKYACGVQGAGEGPAGGTSLVSTSIGYEMPDKNNINIKSTPELGTAEKIVQLSDDMYTILFKNRIKSLILILR